jgi:hypothetical protein
MSDRARIRDEKRDDCPHENIYIDLFSDEGQLVCRDCKRRLRGA